MSSNPLVGAWRLLSYTLVNEKGEVIEPLLFGPDPQGMLIYTEDGYMSANLMYAHRPGSSKPYASEVSTEEKKRAFDTYLGYSGTYEQQRDRVIHHVTVSSLPNWTSSDQVRLMELDGDQLTLSLPPAQVNGEIRISKLTWRRLSSP